MLVKKLAVPLINEKILQQAEYVYIATAGISEPGFDFIRSRLSPKCKMEIVTGLSALTSPSVLHRIWKNYAGRISLHLYTRNFFHANLYIFDLPFRKSVAFVGSGQFTLEGIKDHEELFEKVTDPKEIEALKSWFIGYNEYATPLSEAIIQEYELIYPAMKQREIASRQEQQQLIALTATGFNWDSIKFKNQYFKKEDFLVLGNTKAALNDEAIIGERLNVQTKLLQLHEAIKDHQARFKLYSVEGQEISSLNPADHPDQKLRAISLRYGRSGAELKKLTSTLQSDFITLEVAVLPREIGIRLVIGNIGASKTDREHFYRQMLELEYKVNFFKAISKLGGGYWIELAGDKRAVESFQNEEQLWEFVKTDDWRYYSFVIGKNYSPGEAEIGIDHIANTVMKETERLAEVYGMMKQIIN